MDNVKSDRYYAEHIVNEIDAIVEYMEGVDRYSFLGDNKLIDAIMFRLVQMIEHIKHISKEFKQEHSSIPWGDIIGFRNGIVHEYGETDYNAVYEIVTEDIRELRIIFIESLSRV